jgi:hypothetical protein
MYTEDNMDELDTGFEDDSDLPCEVVMVHIINLILPDRVTATADDNLVSTAEVESMENVESESDKPDDLPVVEEQNKSTKQIHCMRQAHFGVIMMRRLQKAIRIALSSRFILTLYTCTPSINNQ